MNAAKHPRTRVVLLVVIAVLVGLALGALMPFGPGLRDDSYTFIHAGEVLGESGTYSRVTALGELRPVTNFPPLYSLVLSLFHRVGVPLFESPKVLNQLLFSVLVLATAAALSLGARSAWATVFGLSWTLLSPPLTSQFTWAQSEPLFLVLMEFGLLAAFLYSVRRGGMRLLGLSGVFIGLAVVTRYAGLGIVAGVLVVLWADAGKSRGHRLRESLLFLSLSLTPLLLFLFRNLLVAGDIANRPSPHWHPPPLATWSLGAETILRWFLPDRLVGGVGPTGSTLMVAVGAAILGLLLVRVLASPQTPPEVAPAPWALARLLAGAILGYLGGIVVTALLLDRLITFDDRILVPAYYLLLQLAVLGVAPWLRNVRLPIALVLAGFVTFQAVREIALVRALREDGQGYSAREWRESEVLRFVCGLPAIPVFSNDVPALYFACGRHVFPLPSRTNAASLATNLSYPAEMLKLEAAVQHEEGVIVIVGWYGEERLERLGIGELIGGLQPLAVFDDGIVYAR
jgi:hypothetical protein